MVFLEGAAAAKDEAGRVDSRRHVHEMIAEALRGAIVSGAAGSGGILRPSVLAEVFKVSRVPVSRALETLEQSGLLTRHSQRGFVIAGVGGVEHVLSETDIKDVTSSAILDAVRCRTWRDRIYPDLEREVAGRLLFGHFQIRSQALAKHYGVSRTVANELMVGLERVGIVRRESNARWYAGPLTKDQIAELFELRILLEPAALQQAAEVVTRPALSAMQKRVSTALAHGRVCPPALLHQLEVDLHHRVVLRCANSQMREVLYRCQLPLITSHLAFDIEQDRPEVTPMLQAHAEILAALLEQDLNAAAAALSGHLHHASAEATERVLRVPRHIDMPPPFMALV
jgi:DNA-binding GntR family transcriptional regulator